jgi:hypothetical protein
LGNKPTSWVEIIGKREGAAVDKINRDFVVLIFVCFIVLTLADVVNADRYRFRYDIYYAFDTDRPGKDYKNFEVEEVGNDDWRVCWKACRDDEKCQAFTFVKSSPRAGRPVGRCYLKYDLPEKIYKRGHISGYKHYFCPELSFTTKSPLPPAIIGGHYSYQINVSGGIKPVEFCPMKKDPKGAAPKCDNSPDQRFSMPPGLKLSKTGLISGQVKCGPGSDLSKCKEMYVPILIKAKNSRPSYPQSITGEFWIHIKNPATSGN